MGKYTFKFSTNDQVIEFIANIERIVDLYDQISLADLDDLIGYSTDDFTRTRVIWRRSDLRNCRPAWRRVTESPTLYEVILPEPGINPTGKVYSTEPVHVDGIHVENNSKSPQPISITVNAAEFSDVLFLQTIREVVESAAKIKDRDILINIIRA